MKHVLSAIAGAIAALLFLLFARGRSGSNLDGGRIPSAGDISRRSREERDRLARENSEARELAGGANADAIGTIDNLGRAREILQKARARTVGDKDSAGLGDSGRSDNSDT